MEGWSRAPAEHRAVSVSAEAGMLQLISLFADCDSAHLQILCFAAERVEFTKGQAVFRQGETGEAAFLVLQGTAEAHVKEDGAERRIAALEPGSFAGELSMIAGLAYGVTVTATSRLAAARIGRDLFTRVAKEFPDFGVQVQRALARKLETTVGDLKNVKPLFDGARAFSRLKVE